MTMRVFQSTLPVWGATVMAPCCAADNVFQSTLPVWGATKCAGECKRGKPNVNPRSPCGERLGHHEQVLVDKTFQSTLPVWGATLERVQHDGVGSISIHAPRVGSDSIIGPKIAASADFNPRSPCGERRCGAVIHKFKRLFGTMCGRNSDEIAGGTPLAR